MMKKLLLLLLLVPVPAFAAGKVQELKTPKGFTIWLVEEHSLPIVTANVSFTGAGLGYDPATMEGRGNMTAALLLEGAGNLGAKQFNEALENDAIRLNVGADDDTLHATLETLTENRERAFALLSDALTRPRFDDEAVSRARAKMLALLAEQSESPNYKLTKSWQESAYGKHPYSRIGIGTQETLNAMKVEDFKNYVTRYITRENIILSVVGDVTPAEITALIDKSFTDLPAKYDPDNSIADITVPAEPSSNVISHDMPQTMVIFGLAGLKRTDPDYIAAYVMNYLIGGDGLSARLGSEIRVKRGLAYAVRSMLEPKVHAGSWRGMFSTRNDQAKNALEALRATLAEFARNGATQQELDDAKAYLTGSFILDLSSNREVANFLTVMQLYGLGSDYLEKRNSLINAVTLADIKRVTARLIDPAKLRIVMVGKPVLQ